MKADDRNARRFGLRHRRTERTGIDEINGDRIDTLVDQIFDRLDLFVYIALARGDDQLESCPAGGLLGAIDLTQVKRIGKVDLDEADLWRGVGGIRLSESTEQ